MIWYMNRGSRTNLSRRILFTITNSESAPFKLGYGSSNNAPAHHEPVPDEQPRPNTSDPHRAAPDDPLDGFRNHKAGTRCHHHDEELDWAKGVGVKNPLQWRHVDKRDLRCGCSPDREEE